MAVATFDPSSISAETRARHARLYSDIGSPLSALVHIEDPAFYVEPWAVYARLQTEAPAYFHEPLNTWILTRYEDIRMASRKHETFSCKHGILLYDGVKTEGGGLGALFAGDGDMVGLTDPPRHGELRRILQPPFTPAGLEGIQERLERFADQMIDLIVPGEQIDWVEQVASKLPVLVAAAILGIPDDEDFFERVRVWTDATEELSSKEMTPESVEHAVGTFTSLNEYVLEAFESKRKCPGDDFLTSLLNDHLDNEKLSEGNRLGSVQLLLAAGADTSRSLLSELIAHLAVFEDQRELLVKDPSLIPDAIEEVLRFSPAARGFARQVVEDVEIHGQQLKVGQRVYLAYEAGNRDPSVFERPHEFDITRPSNRKHVAFGFGAHVCIAAPLVRLETRILLEKLMARYPRFELAGPGKRVESFLRNGWSELPVVFFAS